MIVLELTEEDLILILTEIENLNDLHEDNWDNSTVLFNGMESGQKLAGLLTDILKQNKLIV